MSVWQRSIGVERAAVPATDATRSLTGGITAALVFAALTWVGANVYVPLEPVPVTLQTLFVLLAGSVIGCRYGSLSQIVYLVAGTAGLPVFAGGVSGLGVLGGPTGGYLLSFFVAPWVVSGILRGSTSLLVQTMAFTVGTLVIFAFGIGHLALFYTHDLSSALTVGFVPFIPGAIIKIAAALSIHRGLGALSRFRALRRDA